MRHRRPSVVLQSPEQRVDAHDISVNAVHDPARRSRVADQIVAGYCNLAVDVGRITIETFVAGDNGIDERFGAVKEINPAAVGGRVA